MKSIPLVKATAADIAREINRAAVKNKDYAMDLVSGGVRGNVTGEFLQSLEKDCFDKVGKLTDAGRKKIFPGIPENITLRQIFNGVLKESYGAK